MKYERFMELATSEVADIVQVQEETVCVFPINGTRRWFLMEYPDVPRDEFLSAYLDATIGRHIDVYKMVFNHGVTTLVTPIFGHDILERGDAYLQMSVQGLMSLLEDPRFLDFYEEQQVRVRFYGDYEKVFADSKYAFLLDVFDKVTKLTAGHEQHRLFFGLFANDATEAVANFSVQFFQEQDKAPSKREIVEAYYGEYVKPVDLFIGFDKLSAFDMPLISNGMEDLYFLIAPSLYLSPSQLRTILYDHLFSRKIEPDYGSLQRRDIEELQKFYLMNQNTIFGVGDTYKQVWYPSANINASSFTKG